jgi:hypothetical protein
MPNQQQLNFESHFSKEKKILSSSEFDGDSEYTIIFQKYHS